LKERGRAMAVVGKVMQQKTPCFGFWVGKDEEEE